MNKLACQRISSPGPTGDAPIRPGWGNRWRCCLQEKPHMTYDGFITRARAALKALAHAALRAPWEKAKARGENPDKKSRSGVPKAVGLRNASPSGNSCSLADANCIGPSFPLDPTSKAERGVLSTGHPRSSISSALACALERSLQCRHPRQYNTGRRRYWL